MQLNVQKEVTALKRLTINDLRAKYAELFGDQTRTGNRTWLLRRIAWRMQALAEGGLSERARQRAAELANDADLRVVPPRSTTALPTPERTSTRTLRFEADGRLPPPGTIITRKYKGETLQVQVMP